MSMDKKRFVLNLSIQIEAETEQEAFALLGKEEIVNSIAEAILSEKHHLQEMNIESTPSILN